MAEPTTARSWTAWLLAAPAIAYLTAFTLIPVGLLLTVSFWKSGIYGTTPDFNFGNYVRALAVPLYRDQLIKTIRIALTTTAISFLISYPAALYISGLKGRLKSMLVVLLFLPFWTSFVVRTFLWLPILGRTGLINQSLIWLGLIDQPLEFLLYNEGAVLVGLVYVFTLFMTLPIYLSLDKIDPALHEAANDLGAPPLQAFWRVTLPLSRPGIVSGSIMVFLMSIGSYVTPQLLGGPSGNMYGNVIASQFLANNNWAFGGALSVILIVVVLVGLMITRRWIGTREIFLGGGA